MSRPFFPQFRRAWEKRIVHRAFRKRRRRKGLSGKACFTSLAQSADVTKGTFIAPYDPYAGLQRGRRIYDTPCLVKTHTIRAALFFGRGACSARSDAAPRRDMHRSNLARARQDRSHSLLFGCTVSECAAHQQPSRQDMRHSSLARGRLDGGARPPFG